MKPFGWIKYTIAQLAPDSFSCLLTDHNIRRTSHTPEWALAKCLEALATELVVKEPEPDTSVTRATVE